MPIFHLVNTTMEEEIDFFVRQTTTEVMLALYKLGYTEIHVGGMMRIIGVSDEFAATHDDQRIVIDEVFAKYLQSVLDGMRADISGNHILH